VNLDRYIEIANDGASHHAGAMSSPSFGANRDFLLSAFVCSTTPSIVSAFDYNTKGSASPSISSYHSELNLPQVRESVAALFRRGSGLCGDQVSFARGVLRLLGVPTRPVLFYKPDKTNPESHICFESRIHHEWQFFDPMNGAYWGDGANVLRALPLLSIGQDNLSERSPFACVPAVPPYLPGQNRFDYLTWPIQLSVENATVSVDVADVVLGALPHYVGESPSAPELNLRWKVRNDGTAKRVISINGGWSAVGGSGLLLIDDEVVTRANHSQHHLLAVAPGQERSIAASPGTYFLIRPAPGGDST
jgi:hypothetical protein